MSDMTVDELQRHAKVQAAIRTVQAQAALAAAGGAVSDPNSPAGVAARIRAEQAAREAAAVISEQAAHEAAVARDARMRAIGADLTNATVREQGEYRNWCREQERAAHAARRAAMTPAQLETEREQIEADADLIRTATGVGVGSDQQATAKAELARRRASAAAREALADMSTEDILRILAEREQ